VKLVQLNASAIIPVVVVTSVAVAVIALSLVQAKKASNNLLVRGDKLGLRLDTQGRYFKKHRLTGELRGKPAEVFAYTTGSGKTRQSWAAIAVRAKAASELTFSLKQRTPFFDIVARLFRKNVVGSGDLSFDKKWSLQSNQPDFMRSALLPEMRGNITRLNAGGLASGGHYKYELNTVQYAEPGTFSNAKFCARFPKIAEIVCDLADVADVYTELQKE
jgi:hypothetical protein